MLAQDDKFAKFLSAPPYAWQYYPYAGPDWYASATASTPGNGSISDPWPLTTALASTQVQSGQTVYLRGGTYQGNVTASRAGVTVKAYPGETVVIDGSFTVNAADCTFEGMEVYSSAWTTRQSAFNGSAPADISVLEGFTVNQPSATIRNCTIHDTRQGIIGKADGLIVEDCLFYNNGWLGATDRGHGHGIYFTNISTPARIVRCIFGPAYDDWGVHAYSDAAKPVSNIMITNNTHISKVLIVWSNGESDNLTITGNETWRGKAEIGQASNDHHGITIEDNYFVGAGVWRPLEVKRLKDCSVQRNTIIATDGDLLEYVTPNTDAPISQVWSSNAYHGQGVNDNGTPRTWEAWRTLHGLDADSTRTDSAPAQNRIRVIGDQIVVIYNWENLSSVPAPMAGHYVNCQNPAESITIGAADALPMIGWTVATPIAGAGPLSTFDPQFAVFLVQ